MVRDTMPFGRPGWQLFPPAWEDHHKPVANASMTALCEINGPDIKGPMDPETGLYAPVRGTQRFLGEIPAPMPCRVQQRLSRATAQAVAEQQVTVHDYLVTLMFDMDGVLVDDLVTITESSDGQLVGVRLVVTDVLKGSVRWERDLYCTEELG